MKEYINRLYPYLLLIAVYTVAHGLLLLNQGLYWDSWPWFILIKNGQWDVIRDTAHQGSLYGLYAMLRLIAWSGHPVFLTKLLAFVSWLTAALSLCWILKNKFSITAYYSTIIAALFCVFPVFLVQVDSAVLPYSISYFFFALGSVVYFLSDTKTGILKKAYQMLSLVLYAVSFFTYSFIVFFGLFLLATLIHHFRTHAAVSVRETIRWAKKHTLFILLPVLFWIMKLYWMTPYGKYEGLNSLALPNIRTAIHAVDFVTEGLLRPLVEASMLIIHQTPYLLLFGVLAAVCTAATMRLFRTGQDLPTPPHHAGRRFSLNLLAWGCASFVLGCAPYVLAGRVGNFSDFNSRHFLLIPLGSALLVVGCARIVFQKKFLAYVFPFLLSLCITYSFYTYTAWDIDWYKQQVIIASLARELPPDASYVLFDDQTLSLNARNRLIRYYEYTAYLSDITKSQRTIGLPGHTLTPDMTAYAEALMTYPDWRLIKNFDPKNERAVLVTITSANQKTLHPTLGRWLALKFKEYTYPQDDFAIAAKDIFQLKIEIKSL